MKNKLVVLCGESGVGKSTVKDMIVRRGILPNAVSATTRQRRENEIEGEDYQFLSREEFLKMGDNDELTEFTSYYIPNEGYVYYGLPKKNVDLTKSPYITILNPNGIQQLFKEINPVDVLVIYIKRDDHDRVIDYLNREKGKDVRKVLENCLERYVRDEIDFRDIDLLADYVVENDGNMQDLFQKVVDIIVKELDIR